MAHTIMILNRVHIRVIRCGRRSVQVAVDWADVALDEAWGVSRRSMITYESDSSLIRFKEPFDISERHPFWVPMFYLKGGTVVRLHQKVVG